MAQQGEGNFGYRTVQLIKTERLGTGSYGAVYKAILDDHLPCAGKILHPTLFQFNDPGAMTVMSRFQQECNFLSAIRHPNIVLYLGSYQDRETRMPVLLLELMDESLTKYLEQSQEPLLYHTQVNICHDIALALAHLHTNGIIHRDLSSNNVLLTGAGSRAKITDFGMAKLSGVNHTTMTKCPGTEVYMSPEALHDPPNYTKKLDSFSVGVLGIQIITRQFPDPGPSTKRVRHPRRMLQEVVLETERRKSHIDLIDPTHPLLSIATDCLRYSEEDRPSAQELCNRLAVLKKASQYGDSVQEDQERSRSATHLIDKLQQDLQQKEEVHKENQLLQHKLQKKEEEIQQLQQLTREKDHAIEARERQLRELDQQLVANEQVTAQFQQDLLQREKKLQEDKLLQQEIQRKKQKRSFFAKSADKADRKLQHKNEELQHEKEELQHKNEELQHEKEELQRKNEELQHAKQQLQQEKEDLQCRKEEFQHELQLQQKQLLRVSQEKDCAIEARERRIQCLKEEKSAAQQQLRQEKEELQREKQHLQQENEELQREKDWQQELQLEQTRRLQRVSQEKNREIKNLKREKDAAILSAQQQIRKIAREKDDVERQRQELNQQLVSKERQIQKLQQQQAQEGYRPATHLIEKNQLLQCKLQTKEREMQQITQKKDRIIQAKDKQLQKLKERLTDSEQVTADFQENLEQSEIKIHKLQEDNKQLQEKLQGKDKGLQQKLTLRWKVCNKTPLTMSRGSATVCGNMAYFRPDDSRQVHSYNTKTEEWSTLPECATYNFTLTVIDNLVTAVGGSQFPWYVSAIEKLTNTLFRLKKIDGRKQWVEYFPSMPTRRKLTTVVCTGKAIVVAGGVGEGNTKLTTVEVMNTDTRQWSTARSLPHPFSDATATVCGDKVYLVGGWDQHGHYTESVFTCFLSDLLQTQTVVAGNRTWPQAENHPAWHTITALPVKGSTCVTLNEQLLAVGGYDACHRISTYNVYSYNMETNSWDVMSSMHIPRYQCLVAVLPGNKLMVVGGFNQISHGTDEVEIAVI